PVGCCAYRFTVPRPHAGRGYTIAYTDGRGPADERGRAGAPTRPRDHVSSRSRTHTHPEARGQLVVRSVIPALSPPRIAAYPPPLLLDSRRCRRASASGA